MFGRMYNEKLAKIAAWLVFIGFNITFFTQFVLGSRGMPRRYYDYLPEFETLHKISTSGTWFLGVAVLMMIGYLFSSLKKGEKAPANPWGARSLEWSIQSPPIEHNFHEIPTVVEGPYEYPKAGAKA